MGMKKKKKSYAEDVGRQIETLESALRLTAQLPVPNEALTRSLDVVLRGLRLRVLCKVGSDEPPESIAQVSLVNPEPPGPLSVKIVRSRST